MAKDKYYEKIGTKVLEADIEKIMRKQYAKNLMSLLKSMEKKLGDPFEVVKHQNYAEVADEFMKNLSAGVEARQSVVREWCHRESIPFFGLTAPLRTAAAAGTQVYYTYDQHWTPDGHEVVTEAVREYLATLPDDSTGTFSATATP